MNKEELLKRSQACELCGNEKELDAYEVEKLDEEILICTTCKNSISSPQEDVNHWHCLNESMWSEVSGVKVASYRILHALKDEPWARDLMDIFYLDDNLMELAKKGLASEEPNSTTKDSNGAILNSGDSVSIVKDLEVKGAGFTAKRGTIVKNISLTDNPEQIEGRVNGVRIVLLSKFLKKA